MNFLICGGSPHGGTSFMTHAFLYTLTLPINRQMVQEPNRNWQNPERSETFFQEPKSLTLPCFIRYPISLVFLGVFSFLSQGF